MAHPREVLYEVNKVGLATVQCPGGGRHGLELSRREPFEVRGWRRDADVDGVSMPKLSQRGRIDGKTAAQLLTTRGTRESKSAD